MRPEVKTLRKFVFEFVRDQVLSADVSGPVLEIGPMQYQWTPVKEYFVDLRTAFRERGIAYLSCDSDSTSQADVHADLLELREHVEAGSIGAIIALEVLEHTSKIWEVPGIFHDLLMPGGGLYLTVPYYFYRHNPFPDYWRISEDGLRLLFGELFEVKINSLVIDDERKPLDYSLIGIKRP